MPRPQASVLLSLATLCVSTAFAAAQGMDAGVQGQYQSSNVSTYVQGQATLDGQPVRTSSLGALRPGQVFTTQNGSADIRLTPGAVLRVGQNSAVEVVATDGRRNEVRLQRGRANVVVNHIGGDTLLLVDMPQGQTQVLSNGLYTFNVGDASVRVFDGEADVFPGGNTGTDIKPVQIHEGHEVFFTGARVRSESFDREDAQNDILPATAGENALASSGAQYSDGGNRGYNGSGYGSYGYGSYGGYPGYAGYVGGYGYGYGYPYGGYGFYGYPGYGYYGYPYGYGLGFGYGGYYRGGGYGYGGYRGGYGYGGYGGGYGGSRGTFGGGGYRGGGGVFGGGGSRSGGGGGTRGGGGGFRPR